MTKPREPACVPPPARSNTVLSGSTFEEANLKDTDWSVRAGAVKTLCEISYDTYAAQVADLLSDRVWLVQFEAAQALADMGASGRELLEVSAISKGNESANRTAALALAELSAMEAVQ